MKFIADSMLGRLARWLRLLGFDTLYCDQINARTLLGIAREENRILLTRNTRLVKMREARAFLLLRENDTFDQLKRVIISYDLSAGIHKNMLSGISIYTRCSLCNSLLSDIPKERTKANVPEYVYQTSGKLRYCKGCGKFYWKGTHRGLFEKKLKEILKKTNSK